MGKKEFTHPHQMELRKVKDRDLEQPKSFFGWVTVKSYLVDRYGGTAKKYGETRKK